MILLWICAHFKDRCARQGKQCMRFPSKINHAISFISNRMRICLGFFVLPCVHCNLESDQVNHFPQNISKKGSAYKDSYRHSDYSKIFKELIEKNLELIKNPHTRRIAAARLGALKAHNAVEPLTKIIATDPDAHSVRAALLALGNIADPSSIPVIQRSLHHPDVEVRKAAIQALAYFEKKDLGQIFAELLLSDHSEIRITTLKALRQSPPEAFRSFQSDKILSRVKKAAGMQQHPGIAVEAVRLLARFSAADVTEELCALLHKHTDLEIRSQAARVLGNISSARSRRCMQRVRSDPNHRLACLATAGLIKLGRDIPLNELAVYLKDPDHRVRHTAVSALGEIGGRPAKQMLQDHIPQEPDLTVRRHTIRLATLLERSLD